LVLHLFGVVGTGSGSWSEIGFNLADNFVVDYIGSYLVPICIS
jgi:hypothetical protein